MKKLTASLMMCFFVTGCATQRPVKTRKSFMPETQQKSVLSKEQQVIDAVRSYVIKTHPDMLQIIAQNWLRGYEPAIGQVKAGRLRVTYSYDIGDLNLDGQINYEDFNIYATER